MGQGFGKSDEALERAFQQALRKCASTVKCINLTVADVR